MSILKSIIMVFFSCMIIVSFIACKKEGPAESTGKKIDKTVERAGEKVEDSAEKAGDKIEETGDKVKESTKK